ncbi:MAG: hypothetical protein AAGH57_05625 [Pseudomonadota bacterium]
MSDLESQNCPICGAQVRFNPRYPQHVCLDCAPRTSSMDERAVHFTSVSPSDVLPGMSLRAFYRDNGEHYTTELCKIDDIVCVAREARMGGVVIQPLSAWRKSPAWSSVLKDLQKQGADV